MCTLIVCLMAWLLSRMFHKEMKIFCIYLSVCVCVCSCANQEKYVNVSANSQCVLIFSAHFIPPFHFLFQDFSVFLNFFSSFSQWIYASVFIISTCMFCWLFCSWFLFKFFSLPLSLFLFLYHFSFSLLNPFFPIRLSLHIFAMKFSIFASATGCLFSHSIRFVTCSDSRCCICTHTRFSSFSSFMWNISRRHIMPFALTTWAMQCVCVVALPLFQCVHKSVTNKEHFDAKHISFKFSGVRFRSVLFEFGFFSLFSYTPLPSMHSLAQKWCVFSHAKEREDTFLGESHSNCFGLKNETLVSFEVSGYVCVCVPVGCSYFAMRK